MASDIGALPPPPPRITPFTQTLQARCTALKAANELHCSLGNGTVAPNEVLRTADKYEEWLMRRGERT